MMRIGIQHQIVTSIKNEQTWTFVVVKIQLFEDVEVSAIAAVATGLDANRPRFVDVSDDLLHTTQF